METATNFGGPYVLLPKRLAREWSMAIGDDPVPESGLYGEVCWSQDFMHLISFQGVTVVRIADDPCDLFLIPNDRGWLVLQWVAADSLDDLVAFGQKVVSADEWQETLEFTITDRELRIMDSCGFDGDDQPKIDFLVDPGEYQISATYAEDENTMATVFQLTKKDQANNTLHPTAGNAPV